MTQLHWKRGRVDDSRCFLVSGPLRLGWTLLPTNDGAFAACPAPQSATVIAYGQDSCVLRSEASTAGNYLVACADYNYDGNGSVLMIPYNSAHSGGAAYAANTLVEVDTQAVDAASLTPSDAIRWVMQWGGRKLGQAKVDTWFRRFNSSFQALSSENQVIDPIYSYDQTRWGGSIAMLSSTRRVAQVESRYVYISGGNSCYAASHYEWRVVLNLRDSNMNIIREKDLVSSGCSYNGFHQGQAGWGQELPDVSASWLFGDFFVATWYDRAAGCKILARVFNQNGLPVTSDILVDAADSSTCAQGGDFASPRVAATPTGFMVVWTNKDQQLWMRTFDLTGNPYISKRLVTSAPGVKGFNPDVDQAYADPCGEGYEAYFGISWWQYDGSYWRPRVIVMQDVTNPVPLIPGWGYTPLTSPGQATSEVVWDRISVNFFSKENASQSSCDDLTMGAAWTVQNGANNEVRKQFLRFQPICPAPGFAATSFDGAELATEDCVAPNCIPYLARPRPVDEPEIIFPDDVP